MEITDEKKGNILIVRLLGRLDTTNFQQLESFLVQKIDQGEKFLLLNCEKLDYISSSGLRVFLFTLKKLGQIQGKMAISNLNASLTEIFTIAGFSHYFQMKATEDEALALFHS